MMKSIWQAVVKFLKKLDKKLLIPVVMCSGLSVLLLYSMYKNGIEGVDAGTYKMQLAATVVGVLVSVIMSLIDYKYIAKLWFIYAIPSLLLVLLTFTPLGYGRAGADDVAWLDLGFMTVQPSEFLKIAFVMTFAFHLSKVEDVMNKPLQLLLLCAHGALPILLVAKQGDYGTAIVFTVMFVAMIFSAGISFKYILAALVALPVAGYVAWNYILQSTHKKRIMILLNPGSDPLGIEYQQNLGKAAMGSGRLTGKGLFGGTYSYVPEAHNDFIFSYLGQVFGFVGCMAVVAAFAYICLKLIVNASIAKDTLGKLICIGVFAMLFTHCFMNIGMVLVVMPVIGIPLPFLSAGGSAMLSMYVSIGLVLSVYAHKKKKSDNIYTND